MSAEEQIENIFGPSRISGDDDYLAVELTPRQRALFEAAADRALAQRRRDLSQRRRRVVTVGCWRFAFWRGPTRFGAHTTSRTAGAVGLGLFGMNWLRKNKPRKADQ